MDEKDLVIEALQDSVNILRDNITILRESNRRLRGVNSMLRQHAAQMLGTMQENDENFKAVSNFDATVSAAPESGLPSASHQVEPLDA